MSEFSDILTRSQFNEPRPEFEGISRHYDEMIRPELLVIDGDRTRSIRRGIINAGFAAAVLIPASLTIPRLLNAQGGLTFFPIVAVMLVFLAYYMTTRHVAVNAKFALMSGLTRFLGWRFAVEAIEPAVFKELHGYKLFPRHNRETFSDHISGYVRDHKFELTEIHLQVKRDKSTTTVFRGMLLSIDFQRSFSGRTIVNREKWGQVKKVQGMKRVGLVSSEFERLFEAYSTDQVEARYLLTPDFMLDLINLEKSVDGKNLRLAFLDNVLHVMIETQDRFEIRSIRKSLVSPHIIQTFIDEFNAIFELIDGLENRLSA